MRLLFLSFLAALLLEIRALLSTRGAATRHDLPG